MGESIYDSAKKTKMGQTIVGALDSIKKKAEPIVEDIKNGAAVTTDAAKTAFNRATMQKDPELSPRTKAILKKRQK
ncbi:hypothetical protein UFOVP1138_46 [uncultured Caudovirales phage]|uniref:Uncharacterized protein n=1 Tax=uncultured Caudovirales phage TaxID=2100421 RepID=A0A6J5QY09_9CAUD|nr:hypothetical protein UFOVP975_75 [uncultured Caudovirales phage]CAB4186261.1 hypothetical protein UFOVP1138_46 [uncultured Caudovirales phage]CAB4204423.1 hypothetical protein UFOVP1394_43 [uncultured Caudovirales phage]